MERDSWQRWSPLAGVAFAILVLTALGVSGVPLSSPSSLMTAAIRHSPALGRFSCVE